MNKPVDDWKTALRFLKSGNRRYREAGTRARAFGVEERRALAEGQNPFAVVVTCSDSRVSPELCFDLGHGDLFVVRTAGNTAETVTLGAIEFAVGVLGVPLVVVMGHSCCAAVINAHYGAEFTGELKAVMEKIRPAVEGCGSVYEAIRSNADNVVDRVKANEAVRRAGAVVMAAYFDIESGLVTFFDE